jgi:DNA primase
VASLGTALTPEQVKLLGRFARRIVVNYDGDNAGMKAAKRSLEVFEPLVKYGFEVKVLTLPNNADPDEFIKDRGVEEYNKLRGAALPYLEFILHRALQKYNLRNPKEKTEALEEVLPFIRLAPDRVQRSEYFEIALNSLRIHDSKLREEFRRAADGPTGVVEVDLKRVAARAMSTPATVAEQRLLELLVNDRELRRAILPQLEEDDYETLPTAAVFRALAELESKGAAVDFASLSELTADDPVASDIVPLLLMSEPERAEGEAPDDLLAEAESCLRALRTMRLDRRLKELAAEITEADRAGDDARRDRLIMEDLELKRRRQQMPEAGG